MGTREALDICWDFKEQDMLQMLILAASEVPSWESGKNNRTQHPHSARGKQVTVLVTDGMAVPRWH